MKINRESIKDILSKHVSAKIQDVAKDEEFIVNDFFLEDEWNKLIHPYPANIGAHFYHHYAKDDDRLEILGETPQGQRIYKKK